MYGLKASNNSKIVSYNGNVSWSTIASIDADINNYALPAFYGMEKPPEINEQ